MLDCTKIIIGNDVITDPAFAAGNPARVIRKTAY